VPSFYFICWYKRSQEVSIKKEQEWSNKRLQSAVRDTITKFFETILDFSEVAVGDEKRYKALRSKILRHGNDTIRKLTTTIESDYDVTYNKILQDEVRFVGVKKETDK